MKSIKKILVVMAIATLILTITVATASATTDVKDEKKNSGIAIESKEKKISSYKITWNYNGGKIGTKKTKVTTVKKGSKIGKLPANPKKGSYTFKGWYTKKNGGKKISVNTKPGKSVTYFAKWSKKSTSSGKIDSNIVGQWRHGSLNLIMGITYYTFKANGSFIMTRTNSMSTMGTSGKYYTSGGKVYLTNLVYINDKIPIKDKVSDYRFGRTESGTKTLLIKQFSFTDEKSDGSTITFYKSS